MINKKKQQTIIVWQEGFSLIELMAAIAIAGVLIGSIGGFLTIHLRSFETSGSMINLQVESQMAMNTFENIFIESKGIILLYNQKEEDSLNNKTCDQPKYLVVKGESTLAIAFYYNVSESTIQFVQKSSSELETMEKINELDKNDWYDFAYNVTSWKIESGVNNKSLKETDNINLSLNMELKGADIEVGSLYKMRNKE